MYNIEGNKAVLRSTGKETQGGTMSSKARKSDYLGINLALTWAMLHSARLFLSMRQST